MGNERQNFRIHSPVFQKETLPGFFSTQTARGHHLIQRILLNAHAHKHFVRDVDPDFIDKTNGPHGHAKA